MNAAGDTVLIVLGLLVPFAVIYGFKKMRGVYDAGFDTFICGVIFWVSVLIICLIYSGVERSESPDLVTLKKAEWSCVHTHREHRLVGKVMTTVDVCDTYQSIYTENE